jgi:hypothetical protein
MLQFHRSLVDRVARAVKGPWAVSGTLIREWLEFPCRAQVLEMEQAASDARH